MQKNSEKGVDRLKKSVYYITVLIVIAQLLQLVHLAQLRLPPKAVAVPKRNGGEAVNIIIDYHSRTPIYEQIKDEIILAVSRGELKKDEQLPSLRTLSSELSININTIKRAFSELEDQGITYSVAGKGIFISGTTHTRAYLTNALNSFNAAAVNAKVMGAEKNELIELIEKLYEGDDKK